MRKIYQSDDIDEMFSRLSKSKKIAVLMSALSHMQSYNGRSKIGCIALAMGYESNGMGNYTKKSES